MRLSGLASPQNSLHDLQHMQRQIAGGARLAAFNRRAGKVRQTQHPVIGPVGDIRRPVWRAKGEGGGIGFSPGASAV